MMTWFAIQIEFHVRFSFGEGRHGGNSPRWAQNTSRSTATPGILKRYLKRSVGRFLVGLASWTCFANESAAFWSHGWAKAANISLFAELVWHLSLHANLDVFFDQSTTLHTFWHERPTLIGTSQLKLCSYETVTVGLTNFCTTSTYANLCVGRKCSICTGGCYSTVGALRYHLHQHHRVGQSNHPPILRHHFQHVHWSL